MPAPLSRLGRHLSSSRCAALAAPILAITLACSSGNEPCPLGSGVIDGIGSSTAPIKCQKSTGPQPLALQVSTITGLTGRPFGVAVSPDGTIYVTQQDANSVARLSLATSGVAGT